MTRKTDIISITKIEQIPTIETIKSTPRGRILKIVFEGPLNEQREEIGESLKKKLPGFQVGIHVIESEINIAKLITDIEIEDNQDFFEKCAKDYRLLGEELIFKLVDKLAVTLNKDYPLQTFNLLKQDKNRKGKMGDWYYHVHGYHCGFENTKTEQIIEVPLVFGLEFGDLDPYFFSKFIKSTPEYLPLPVEIYEDYADGARINEKMLSLGKFERIHSNIGNNYGTVVKDRKKVEIKSHQQLQKIEERKKAGIKKSKFSFWKFLGLRK